MSSAVQLAAAREFLQGYRDQVVKQKEAKQEYSSGPVQASLGALEGRVAELRLAMEQGQREEDQLRAELANAEVRRVPSCLVPRDAGLREQCVEEAQGQCSGIKA